MQVVLLQCLQEHHDLKPDEGAMWSRVEFAALYNGKPYKGSVRVQQKGGNNYRTDPLEVGDVVFNGPPFPFQPFRDEVERYYRRFVGVAGDGGRGAAIVAGPGVQMSHNVFVMRHSFFIEIDPGAGGW